MQTFTLFFGIAIVAIAMENLTSKLLFVKTSDADAKGYPNIQSRATLMQYSLRGITGKEKVTVTDGKEVKEHSLEKEITLFATNPKIIIDFTNDECCTPDRNVIFTSEIETNIYTANNTFTTNYTSNWNCSSCPDKSMQKTKKRTDLLSSRDMLDRCDAVRNTEDDFCDNCKILEEGQLCQPGKYTIEFQTMGQCRGVTFGGCKWPAIKAYDYMKLGSVQSCNRQCSEQSKCYFYRYNLVTQNCTLLTEQDRSQHCNIRAAPKDKKDTVCLNIDNNQICDALLEEECEYGTKDNGDLVKEFQDGLITSSEACQISCELDFPDCQYWIFHTKENRCILRKSETKKCTYQAGPKKPSFNDCRKTSPNW